jgi:hypothetical protein
LREELGGLLHAVGLPAVNRGLRLHQAEEVGIPVDDYHQLGLHDAVAGLHGEYGGELPEPFGSSVFGVTGW